MNGLVRWHLWAKRLNHHDQMRQIVVDPFCVLSAWVSPYTRCRVFGAPVCWCWFQRCARTCAYFKIQRVYTSHCKNIAERHFRALRHAITALCHCSYFRSIVFNCIPWMLLLLLLVFHPSECDETVRKQISVRARFAWFPFLKRIAWWSRSVLEINSFYVVLCLPKIKQETLTHIAQIHYFNIWWSSITRYTQRERERKRDGLL